LFTEIGIYSSKGQLYEPVDKKGLSYYREAKDGQILEEGITEAGSMASFVAAGTAYANYGVNLIPFTFTIRCSDRSAWATKSGWRATARPRVSSWARLPAARLSTAKDCNIRTDTAR
jgi:hypothetical protein